MKNMKKWLSVWLAVCLLISVLPPRAFAVTGDSPEPEVLDMTEQVVSQEAQSAAVTSGTCGENLTWELTDGVLTISGTGEMKDYTYTNPVPPWRGDGFHTVVISPGVTGIGNYAFAYCDALTDIEIPDSVTSIGIGAFISSTALKSVQIPDSVTSMGNSVFYLCSGLTTVSISAGLTGIENTTFRGCSALTDVKIPAGVTSIGEFAFASCTSLTSVEIPAGVTEIGMFAFSGCEALSSIQFVGNAPEFGNNVFSRTITTASYPAGNTTWTEDVMQDYGGTVTWIPYTPTVPAGSDAVTSVVQELPVDEENSILIKPVRAENSLAGMILDYVKDPELTITTALGQEVVPDGGYQIRQSDATRQDMVLKRKDYRDYIIPTEVSASLQKKAFLATVKEWFLPSEYIALMQQDRADGKPYLSTIFGRPAGEDAQYQELKNSKLELYHDAKYDFIITSVGLEGKNPTYYIAQDGTRKISSKTGVFSSVDLYEVFTYGKDAYAYAITESGETTAQEKLKITKIPKEGDALENFLASSTFSLVGKKGQAIKISEDFPLVGGANVSLAAFQSPIGIDINGSDVKISFGVDIFSKKSTNGSPSSTSWVFDNFKKSFKTLSSNVASAEEELALYKTFKEQYSDEYSGYYEKKKNFDVEFLGYAEATVVNGELVFKEILVNVKGQFTFKYTQQGAVWVIPAYYYVEAGVGVGLTTQWARLLADKDIPLDFGFILEIEPELKLGGGAGIKNAVSAGVYGKGSLPYENNFSEKHHTLKLKGEFGLEAEFFIVKGNMDLLKGTSVLLDDYYGSAKTSEAALNSLKTAQAENAVSVVSRDYSASTSEWLGSYPSVATFGVAANGVSFRDLQTSVFERAQPQVVPCGDDLLMVWVEDDPSRDAYNRMRLVYSVYDSAADTWSVPQPVCDDGHNDAYPSLASDGTKVYVAWQKIDKTLTEADCTNLNVFLEQSELYAAAFDAASGWFGEAVKLTDNNAYEYAAVVTIENNAPVVYYAGVTGSEMSSAGAHTLYRQSMTGTAQTVADSLNYILGVDAAHGSVSYVMDGDGNTATTNDIGVYTVAGGTTGEFPKGDNEAGFTFAAYGKLEGKSALFVSDLSNIYYMEDGESKLVFASDRTIGSDIEIVNASAGTTIFWTEQEEIGNELYAVRYEDGAWTKPVKVSENGKLLSAVDVAVLDGKPVGVCNATAVTEGADGQTEKGATDLCFFVVNDFMDVAVSDYISFDETTAEPGRDQSFAVYVSNKGTLTADTVTFTVTDTLGTSHTETKELKLLPGNMQAVTLTYPVPAGYAPTTLEVTAAVSGHRDADAENNTASIAIGKPDLSVRESATYLFDDGYIVNVTVENLSGVAAEDVSLSVALNDKANAPVHTQKLGTLGRDTYANVDLALGKDVLSFDENGVAKVYLQVSSKQTDAADADNTLCLLITKPVESCTHTDADGNKVCDVCGSDMTAEETGVLGDANGDGKVLANDAMLVLQYSVGAIKADKLNTTLCDVNGDGKILANDAMLILQYSVGAIQKFPGEK